MTERKSVLLRLDPAVHDALARWAGDELRSTNAQIEFLLRRALADAGRLPGRAGPMRPRGRPPAASRTATSPPPPGDDQPGPTSRPECGQEHLRSSNGRLAAAGEHEHVAAFIDLEPAGPCAESALPGPDCPCGCRP